MKVLITGASGYVGSVLTRELLGRGYEVLGVDNLSGLGAATLAQLGAPKFEFLNADIRDSSWMSGALSRVDAVIHLAAIVGDPACAKDPAFTTSVNWDGACALFDSVVRSPNVSRFIFTSTCSNYGKSETEGLLNEDSPLKPVSLYAELKVKFEKYILAAEARSGLTITPLRFATVYGLSPRMRFDLTVNEFARDAYVQKKLVIFGEQFWRPYCHTRDIARACIAVLEAPTGVVHREVFNVGSTAENYQKKMIAEILQKFIPDLSVEYVQKKEDPRDYKVSFDKIAQKLSFTPEMTVPKGIEEILQGLKQGAFGDPYSSTYSNI